MRKTANSYEDILSKATEIVDKLDKLGIWPTSKQSRYHYYIKMLSSANVARKTNSVREFLKQHNTDGKFWFMLKQIYELTTILSVVIEVIETGTDIDTKNELVSRIKKTLVGPNYPSEENQDNSSARNTQFELLIVSKLYRSGFKDIKCLLNPDILTTLNSRKYPIECKRITGLGDDALVKAVRRGVKQIKLNWKEAYFSGVVAVDLSVQYEQGNNVLECDNYLSGDAFIQHHLEKRFNFLSDNCPTLTKAAIEKKIVGVLLTVSIVYVLKDYSDMGWISELALGVMSEENPEQAPVFISDFTPLEFAKMGI